MPVQKITTNFFFCIKRRENMSIETFCSQIDEYRNMDKKTVIKMLLASQEENKKLHEKLDKQTEKLDKQDEQARARDERLHKRIDELTSINMRASENARGTGQWHQLIKQL